MTPSFSDDTPPPLTGRRVFFFAVVMLLSLVYRIYDIGIHPWAPDEGFSVELAGLPWGEMVRRTAEDTHPPFYYAILKLWYAFTPNTLFWAKMFSVAASIPILVYVFLLTRRVAGEFAGWAAFVTAAFAPFQVFWSHIARNHQFMPLFVVAVVFHTLAYARDQRPRDWWMLLVAWILCIQNNYMAFPFGVVWGLAVMVECWGRRAVMLRLYATGIIALVTILPWAHYVMEHAVGGRVKANRQEVVSPFLLFYHSVFGAPMAYQEPQAGIGFIIKLLVFALVLVAGARLIGKRWGLWILILGAPCLPLAISQIYDTTMAERHLVFSVPLFMVWWGAGVRGVMMNYELRMTNEKQSADRERQVG